MSMEPAMSFREGVRSAIARGGGCLYHFDHSIPRDVSFRKYSFVMDCVRRYGAY